MAKTTKKSKSKAKATKPTKKTKKPSAVVTEQSAPGMPILVNGKTLGEIGREIGVSASYMSRLKRGKRAPSLAVLDKLVVATGLSLDQVREVFAPVGQGEVAYGQVQTTTKKGKGKTKGKAKAAKKAKAKKVKAPKTPKVKAKTKAKPAPKARTPKAPKAPKAKAVSLIPTQDHNDDGEALFADNPNDGDY